MATAMTDAQLKLKRKTMNANTIHETPARTKSHQ
jgi:hypothetical protein